MIAPVWYVAALHEIGFHEKGDNQGIERFISEGHCGHLGDPWCAIFVNAKLETSGLHGSRSPASQSFRHDENFIRLTGPAFGAIAVFWRGSRDSGLGHVGFYSGERGDHIWVLGGNEGDMVQIEALPRNSSTFGLVGYYWPKSATLPLVKVVQVAANAPVHQTTKVT